MDRTVLIGPAFPEDEAFYLSDIFQKRKLGPFKRTHFPF